LRLLKLFGMNPRATFWLRAKERKFGFSWVVATWLALSIAVGVSIWFYAYKTSTQMSMETWASYAGKLQARVWFQEGRYRLLELTSYEKSQFTGRSDGPFEIWTWTGYTNTPSLTVQTADIEFVESFNSRMRQLWEDRQRGAEQSDPHEPPPRVSVSTRRGLRTLDSQPAPVSGGGR
jgi:hypothetical protein